MDFVGSAYDDQQFVSLKPKTKNVFTACILARLLADSQLYQRVSPFSSDRESIRFSENPKRIESGGDWKDGLPELENERMWYHGTSPSLNKGKSQFGGATFIGKKLDRLGVYHGDDPDRVLTFEVRKSANIIRTDDDAALEPLIKYIYESQEGDFYQGMVDAYGDDLDFDSFKEKALESLRVNDLVDSGQYFETAEGMNNCLHVGIDGVIDERGEAGIVFDSFNEDTGLELVARGKEWLKKPEPASDTNTRGPIVSNEDVAKGDVKLAPSVESAIDLAKEIGILERELREGASMSGWTLSEQETRKVVSGDSMRMSIAPNSKMKSILSQKIAPIVESSKTKSEFLDAVDEAAISATDAYLENVYRTETANIYQSQRLATMDDPDVADFMWGVELFSVTDARTRPSHGALDGLMLRKGSEAYNAWLPGPPYSYMCRCTSAPVMVGEDATEPPNALDLVRGIERFND